MILKDRLKHIFYRASIDNDIFVKEKIFLKWVHRFGLDSLNDLLVQSSFSNQEKINLKEEVCAEENQEKINLKEEVCEEENQEKTFFKSIAEQNLTRNEFINKNKLLTNKNKSVYRNSNQLPLPKINSLRKWINNDKKAS